MADRLRDWAPIEFTLYVLAKHPAPIHPETGEKMWEQGIRLHGSQRDILGTNARFKQIRGGVRAGKSFIGALAIYIDYHWMIGELGRKKMLWWVVGPDYEQAKEEMRHLHRLFSDANIPHTYREPEKDSASITFPHRPEVEIVTKSGKNTETIAGRAPRGIVMAEAAQNIRAAWDAARERVIETRGWVLMEGTFEGAAAWYHEIAKAWSEKDALGVSFALPSWDNRVLFPLGRQEPVFLSEEVELTPAKFMERYGGEPQKPSNLVIPQADKRFHIGHRYPNLGISFDPEQPVYLAIDPGAAHAYAVFPVQFWKNVAWVIDAVYRWGRDATAMVDECAARPWARYVEMAVMDIAGEQQSSTGPPNAEQWRTRWLEKVGSPLAVISNRVPLAVGYEIHRRALLNSWPEAEAKRMFDPEGKVTRVTDPEGPRLVFAPEAAAPLFGGLVDGQYYAGEYQLHHNPRRRDGSIPRDVPVDEDNDAIKALNYLLFWYFGARGKIRFVYDPGTSVPWEVTVAS